MRTTLFPVAKRDGVQRCPFYGVPVQRLRLVRFLPTAPHVSKCRHNSAAKATFPAFASPTPAAARAMAPPLVVKQTRRAV